MKRKRLLRGLALLLVVLLVLGVAAVPLSTLAVAGDAGQTVTTGGDIGLEGLVGSGNMIVITVTDADGKALSDVQVTLSVPGHRATTNKKGVVVFDRLTLSQTYTMAVEGYDQVDPSSFAPTDALAYLTVTAIKQKPAPPEESTTPTSDPGDGGGGGGGGGGGDSGGEGGDEPSTPPTTDVPPPSSEIPPPSSGVTPPVTDVPLPSSGITPPSSGITPPSSGITPPSSGITPPSGGVTLPTTDIPPSSGMTPSTSGVNPPPSEMTPSAGTSPKPAPSVPEDIHRPQPPIEIVTPDDRILVPDRIIEDSAVGEADVEVIFRDEEGHITDSVVMAPFNPHDKALVEHSEVWVERRENDRPIIQILKEHTELVSDANIPHNIIESARALQADVRVTFQKPGGGVYDFDALFPAEFFAHSLFDDQDITMEYDPKADQGWLVFSNQAEIHWGKPLIAPALAYEKAAEDGWGIKVRIYNPEESTDLWYEWVFRPEDLKKIAGSLTDTDLLISPRRPTLTMLNDLDTRKNYVQYLNIAYHGQLPVPASLRVKNMVGFRQSDEVTLMYCNEQAGALQSLLTGLVLDEDGYFTYGVEHCSVYILVAPKPPVSVWRSILGAVFLPVLLIAVFLFLGRRAMDELTWQVLGRLDAWSKHDRSASEEEAAVWFAAELAFQEVKATPREVRRRLRKLLRKGYARGAQGGITITAKGEVQLRRHRGSAAEEVVKHEQNK